MAKTTTIVGIDIGTFKVRTVVAAVRGIEEKPKIIGVGEALSNGMRKGMVIDIDEVAESVRQSVEQAELSCGIPIKCAFVSIGGSHITIRENKGLVAVSRADQEVSEEDISRVIHSASAISLPLNREILHVIPRDFKLDSEDKIQNPLGMTGARLEVDVLIVDGLSPYIRNLTKCVLNSGIKINSLVLNVLAASSAVLSKRQKELGVLVLDLGGGTVSMTVYEEGKLLHAHILPVGVSHITNDIAIGLRTTIDLAEKIKLQYGSALSSEVKKNENINLSEIDETESGVVNRREVAKIIEARAQEIFELVNRELKKIGKQKLLPAGVVLVGGGAIMPYMAELAKRELGLPAEVGFPIQVESVIEKVNSPAFATAVGLIIWGLETEMWNNQKSATISKLKKWFQALLP